MHRLAQERLVRRFRDDDPAQIEQRMRAANAKLSAFMTWANRARNPGDVAEVDVLVEALKVLAEWLRGVSRENEAAINQLRDDLKDCRLADWNDLRD